MTIHWHAPTPPQTIRIDLRIEAVPLPGIVWQREPPACCRPLDMAMAPVRVVSIPIVPGAVRVRSFSFAQPAAAPLPQIDPHDPAAPGKQLPPSHSPPAPVAAGHTRIKPPRDVVKLCDRLEYLLQPSLELLLADGSLAFPAHPFPFQLEGVAFLYPRQAAILADEMGLGKTMQAITAIRLLLHRKVVRSVLLVCPKPLVTNWQREFALWAPEVPTMTIEGEQAKRRWLWQLPDVPLRIANYEVLLRDFAAMAGGRQESVVPKLGEIRHSERSEGESRHSERSEGESRHSERSEESSVHRDSGEDSSLRSE